MIIEFIEGAYNHLHASCKISSVFNYTVTRFHHAFSFSWKNSDVQTFEQFMQKYGEPYRNVRIVVNAVQMSKNSRKLDFFAF